MRRSFRRLRRRGAPFLILYLDTKMEKDPGQVLTRLRRFGARQVIADRLMDGRRREGGLLAGQAMLQVPGVHEYAARPSGPSCLHGRLAVGHAGELRPCPHMSEASLGALGATSIPRLLAEDGLQSFWDSRPPADSACGACPIKHACDQCFILRRADQDRLDACNYDPWTGDWV
jgi:radical SAM protein with 4Fe4S-binding SPASM domain